MRLGTVAGATIKSFTVVFARECTNVEGLGALPCSRFDGTFVDAVTHNVVEPLAERGITVPPADVADLKEAAGT